MKEIGSSGSRLSPTSADLVLYIYQITCNVIYISTNSTIIDFLRRSHNMNPMSGRVDDITV